MPETPSRKREATRIADAVKIASSIRLVDAQLVLAKQDAVEHAERGLNAAEVELTVARALLKFAREIAPLDARARRMVAAGIGSGEA